MVVESAYWVGCHLGDDRRRWCRRARCSCWECQLHTNTQGQSRHLNGGLDRWKLRPLQRDDGHQDNHAIGIRCHSGRQLAIRLDFVDVIAQELEREEGKNVVIVHVCFNNIDRKHRTEGLEISLTCCKPVWVKLLTHRKSHNALKPVCG